MKPPSQERLKELLHYDPETGVFTWRGGGRAGAQAGSKNFNGYWTLKILGQEYKAHRIAFLYMTGEFPPEETDHINRIKDDNRWINLRAVSKSENQKNMPVRKDSTSGCPGVNWDAPHNKWRVRLVHNSVRVELGFYTDLEQAVAVRHAHAKQWRKEGAPA